MTEEFSKEEFDAISTALAFILPQMRARAANNPERVEFYDQVEAGERAFEKALSRFQMMEEIDEIFGPVTS